MAPKGLRIGAVRPEGLLRPIRALGRAARRAPAACLPCLGCRAARRASKWQKKEKVEQKERKGICCSTKGVLFRSALRPYGPTGLAHKSARPLPCAVLMVRSALRASLTYTPPYLGVCNVHTPHERAVGCTFRAHNP